MSDDPPAPLAEHRSRHRWGWYALQIAIVALVTVGTFEGSGRRFSLGICFLGGLALALGITVFGTMTVDWFRYRPAREKVFWAAMVVAMTAAGGTAFFALAPDPGETLNVQFVWVPFALVFPVALFVWLVIGVGGLFRRSPKRELPLVQQHRRGSLPVADRPGHRQPVE